jgi:hypothetical protein
MTTNTLERRKRETRTSRNLSVYPKARDLIWFEKLAYHGALTGYTLHQFTKHLPRGANEAASLRRAGTLFHEKNTPDGGAYLDRPEAQFATLETETNDLIYDINLYSRRALEAEEIYAPPHKRGWDVHQFMTAHITSSIELATGDRFIPQHEITDKPLSIPLGGNSLTPDAMFGIKYGNQKRVFLVEADRATEVVRSEDYKRKTAIQNFKQYGKFVREGLYKQHFGIKSGLMLLFVTVNETRMYNLIDLLMELSNGKGNNYILFKTIPSFIRFFKPPKPDLALFTEPWKRAGHPDFYIDK